MNHQSRQQILDLLDVAAEIGAICDSNACYQQGLSARLQEAGTPLHDLTVGELLDLIREQTRAYNKLHRRISA